MKNQQQIPTSAPNIVNILALDVGSKRIGLAIGNTMSRLARPLRSIEHNSSVWMTLKECVTTENVACFVVGLPRNLSGDNTPQTTRVRQFAAELERHFNLPVYLQDEALTSRQAELELKMKGHPYQGSDIDSMAASLILSDYLSESRPHVKTK